MLFCSVKSSAPPLKTCRLLSLKMCGLISNWSSFIPSSFFLFAASFSRRNVRVLLQGLGERHPRPQHLRPGAVREDREHLHTPPSLPPTFQTGVRAADRHAVAHQPAAGRAQHRQCSQQEPGCCCKQILSEPLPKPASAGASRGPDYTTSTSECLPAEGLRLCGPEDLQGLPVECVPRTEDSKKQGMQKKDGN